MIPEPFTPDDSSFGMVISEAESQGFGFVGRFAARWISGEFLFDRPGEKLLAIRQSQQIIAFGGICFDPYSSDRKAGRLRHLYVLNEWRSQGYGASLISALIRPPHPFSAIRLRAGDEASAEFYEALGWVKSLENNTTHELVF